jgi:putative transposase
MKKSHFSEPQRAFILRQAEEGVSVEEVCRQAGINQATYYNWEMKRLKTARSGESSVE